MAKNSAQEAELGVIHAKMAKVMSRVLDSYDKAQEAFEKLLGEGLTAESILEFPEISPAMLTVILKFLADNSITAAPEDNKETSDLAKRLDDRAARRAGRASNVLPFPEVGT